MTNKRVSELDAEFIEYKAKAKAHMDALEKKIDEGIEKLDASIKAMKEESDAKFEEVKQLILGSQSTHVDPGPQITKVGAKVTQYVPPTRRGYDDIGDSGVVFVEGVQPTGSRHGFWTESQLRVDSEMQHMVGAKQTGGREHREAGTNQVGDRFAYHGFEHRMRKLKMSMFEGEDAYGWIYRVERWSEGRTPFHSWDGFKSRLLIRFQQSKEGNMYEKFLAITHEGSARAYIALFEILACQLVGVPETVMGATFIKGLKPALRAAVRVMNPEGLSHAMELAVSIEDNQLFEGVMQSQGVAAIVGQTTSVVPETPKMDHNGVNFRVSAACSLTSDSSRRTFKSLDSFFEKSRSSFNFRACLSRVIASALSSSTVVPSASRMKSAGEPNVRNGDAGIDYETFAESCL
ncbi:ankyrin repeat-containing protein [Tanacetum coccineum]